MKILAGVMAVGAFEESRQGSLAIVAVVEQASVDLNYMVREQEG
jgi:hypothetical protein